MPRKDKSTPPLTVDQITDWLMEGDPAIRWQTMRDLLGASKAKWQVERSTVATTGWGARLLAHQDAQGTWGGGVYTPKWTSTTYTLLQLRELGLDHEHPAAQRGTNIVLDELLGQENTKRFSERLKELDLCIVGMCLTLAVYFRVDDFRREAIAQRLLEQEMPDGGWNCSLNKYSGATHSSFHTTFNVLDGVREYLEAGHRKHRAAFQKAEQRALELVLQHKLFRSDKTDKIIHPKFTTFAYPYRWHYDVMRGLDYMQRAGAPRDERAQEAIELVRTRHRADGLWSVYEPYAGKVFFRMETNSVPSRWNTLRALRVLRWWDAA
jgi:hypothetical protein